jgi:hypothetical protein
MINFFKILGPIFGFLIGSVVNKLYYTFPNSAPRGLTPQAIFEKGKNMNIIINLIPTIYRKRKFKYFAF